MNPHCARCGKIVYATEKVNCLDKVRPTVYCVVVCHLGLPLMNLLMSVLFFWR